MHVFRRYFMLCAGALLCGALAAPALAALPERSSTEAPRSLAPAALHGSLIAALAPATPLSLIISLRGQHQAELEPLIAAQNTPGSPYYGKYLTPEQFGRYFGATDRDRAMTIASLRARGFAIDELFANRTDIEVHAPASVVEAFFGTPIDVRTEGGRPFFTNRYAPQMPAGIPIESISGLEDYLQLRAHHEQRQPFRKSKPLTAWTPADIQSVYNLTPIYTKYTGSGVTVVDATVGLVRPSDFSAFEKKFGLKASLSQVAQKNSPYDNNGESTLDVEWMSAVAPRAKLVLVSPKTNSNAGFTWMYDTIVNKMSNAKLVSTSWGSCEQTYSMYGYLQSNEKLFAQADAEGQWWMSAAGDWGSDDCELNSNGVVSVDYPGSSKHVMSVGGTSVAPSNISQGAFTGWSSEVVWNGCGAGGGGNSIFFTRPTFQNGLTNSYARQVPDVVLMADGCDLGGYLVYFKGSWGDTWGGTSFASPEWAAFLSLVQSRYGSKSLPSPRYRLYAMAAASQQRYFHNIVRGCNTYLGVPGYCAHYGYSPVGGLGSFNGAPLQANY